MSKLYLILSIHNHQPVGNFDHVVEEAYKNAYLPFLEKFFAYPKLKAVLHYSGNLLLWLEKNHPEAIDMIKTLLKSGRAELLSGGFYEPILSSLPENDKVMQIRKMNAYIEDRFGYTPKGMWLAERVWEPHMPKPISKAGIEYLSVDDYHFKLAGCRDEELLGYYKTEEEGYTVNIFPGSETLRYMIPFKGIDRIISYLKENYRPGWSPLLTMADDGEKFGVWPETRRHCYEDGWLESFFSALEDNSDWLETTTFKEYQERFYPAGTVYLPTAAYREMGEWALPPEEMLDYEYVLSKMQKLFGERAKGFLRGGTWRSFFAKYPESNHIHKRMLHISKKVYKAVKKIEGQGSRVKGQGKNTQHATRNLLLNELWQGQCNDAYWHGIFGGLYLPHLRSSLYRHLITAESMADEILLRGQGTGGSGAQGFRGFIEDGDIDCDGFRDICISNKDLTAFFTEESGALIELSVKKDRINILDVLTRRPEAYHSKILKTAQNGSGEAKTIHDRLLVKEEGLADYIIYDSYKRASMLDHFLDYNIRLDDLRRSKYEEKGDFIGFPYYMEQVEEKGDLGIRLSREGMVSGNKLKIEKSALFDKTGMIFDYLLEGRCSGIFAVEFNLSFLGSPYTIINAGDRELFMKDTGEHNDIKRFFIRDKFLGFKVSFRFDGDVDLWHYPIETVSLSEQGIERIYQGTSFLFMKKLDFSDKKRLRFSINFKGSKK
ncbi:MAG: DUF1926 domain-containing protein [Nitrospirae bacterium]|nr:DUF1926 domain-containing protein [Nitrospirota bacterium]